MLTFTTSEGEDIGIKFFREKETDASYSSIVHVMKATFVAPHSYSLIRGKVANIDMKSGAALLINGVQDLNYETPDLFINRLTSRRLSVPILNNTDESITLKRGAFRE